MAATSSGLLQQIANMLFKGIDALLDRASEYQEEMGVLKNITRIPVKKDDEEFEVIIKLSPIENRDSTYYVEVESTGPEIDASDLNEKVVKLDKTTTKAFDNKINELLRKNNLEEIAPAKEDSEEDDKYVKESYKYYFDKSGQEIPIVFNVIWTKDFKEMAIDSIDTNGRDLKVTEINNGEFFPADKWEDLAIQFIDDNGLEMLEKGKYGMFDEMSDIHASTCIKVTLQKVTSATEPKLEISAITCSDAIRASEILDELSTSDEFMDMVTEIPTSLSIVETDEDFDIEEIDPAEVEDSSVYDAIVNAALDAYMQLKWYSWIATSSAQPMDSIVWSSEDLMRQCMQHIAATEHRGPEFDASIFDRPADIDVFNLGKQERQAWIESIVNELKTKLDLYYKNSLQANIELSIANLLDNCDAFLANSAVAE